MTGTHEFKITVHLAPEDPELCIVHLKYTIMHPDRNGHVSNSSWMCEAKDGLPMETIRGVLLTSCHWLDNYTKKSMELN